MPCAEDENVIQACRSPRKCLHNYISGSGLLKAEHRSPENEARAWQFYRTPPDHPVRMILSLAEVVSRQSTNSLSRRVPYRRWGAGNHDSLAALYTEVRPE